MKSGAFVSIVLLVAITACAGNSSGTNWQTAKQAVDALKSEGFECGTAGAEPSTRPIGGFGAASGSQAVILCGGYDVLIGDAADLWLQSICAAAPVEDLVMYAQVSVVELNDVTIVGSGVAGEFRGIAQAQDFIDAFGGRVVPLGSRYSEVCGVTFHSAVETPDSHLNDSALIPLVVGQSQQDAVVQLTELGLNVVVRQERGAGSAGGLVVAQIPDSGTRVVAGEIAQLVVAE